MKRLSKKLMAMLAAVAMLCMIPGGFTTLKVSAEEPVTFAVAYVESAQEWRYQSYTSTFDSSKSHRELYYLRRAIRPGDYVVVYNYTDHSETLDLGTTALGNLTIKETKAFTPIFCGDIENCYILGGAFCSINANVKNAYVYGSSTSNFNKNVEEMRLIGDNNGLTCNVGAVGTVDHMYATTEIGDRVFYDLYDFEKESLLVQNGYLQTEYTKYHYAPKMEITAENFDSKRYADDYPDLKAAFGYNATMLYNHYSTNGILEGRVAHTLHSDFDYERYANDYPDLKAVYGNDATALYNHYITNGIRENRVAYDTSNRVFEY